ncbi:hypothetical protein M885DRAFT_534948 [Pelagophyceae sp. CCMP2097]|nr:hypothetical protein M885DRAFT_534948 [Pelagophyceae sp. CCMP2097]
MPEVKKKKKAKGGKSKAAKAAAEALAAAEIREKVEREAEAKHRRKEEDEARERRFHAREVELDDRENAARATEIGLKERARALDDEVASRSARQVKEAEAREATSEKRQKVREAEIAAAEARYARAEGELQMRLVEVRAREAALGDGVVGGIAERLEKMLEEQMDVRDVALSRTKQIEAARAELEAKEAMLMESIAHKEAALARAEEAATHRVVAKERKLTQQDFTLKRRLGRRIKEAEALCEAHRAECAVRDRRFKAREEEVRRRTRELNTLLRKVRRQEAENAPPRQDDRPGDLLENYAAPYEAPYDAPHTYAAPYEAYDAERPPARPQSAPASRAARSAADGPRSVGARAAPAAPLLDVTGNHAYGGAGSKTPPPRAAARYRARAADAPATGSPRNDVERARDQGAEDAMAETQDQFKALIRHVHAMEDDLVDELRGHAAAPSQPPQYGGDDAEDARAAGAAVLCAEGLAQQPAARPFAARRLPERQASVPPSPAFDDGAQDQWAEAPVPAPEDGGGGKGGLKEGEKVEVRYRGREKFYPAKISRDRGDGTFDIDYDDGEKETRVDEKLIRSKDSGSSSSAAKGVFTEGDKIEARYRGRDKFYPGKIMRDRGDGTFDVDYDDGEKETRVVAELIRSIIGKMREHELVL